MKLLEFPILTDENVDADVVAWLRQAGFDVLDVSEQRLFGEADSKLLQLAVASGRIVVTHDADFGTLAVLQGEPIVGLGLSATRSFRSCVYHRDHPNGPGSRS